MSLESPLSDEFLDDLLGAFDPDTLDGELNEPWALGPIADAQLLNGVRRDQQRSQHCIAVQMRQSEVARHRINVVPQASTRMCTHATRTRHLISVFERIALDFSSKKLKSFIFAGPCSVQLSGSGDGQWSLDIQDAERGVVHAPTLGRGRAHLLGKHS